MSATRRKNAAFTLVELLVVMAILSILAALLLPALRGALGVARMTACANKQKQVGMALTSYGDEYAGYVMPTGGHVYASGDRWWDRWIGVNVYEYPVTSWGWCPAQGTWPGFHCPEDSINRNLTWENRSYAVPYYLMVGSGTQAAMTGVRAAELKQPSRTYMLMEVDPNAPYFTLNVVLRSGSNGSPYMYNGMQIYRWHNGRANFLYADGHLASQATWKTGSFLTMPGIIEP